MTIPGELSTLLDELRRDRRRHPLSGRREYSLAARELAGRCEKLLAQGEAPVAVPVLKRAIERVAKALEYLDDSNGSIGGDLRQLMELYARACAAAPPPAKTLATWLVTLVFDGPG